MHPFIYKLEISGLVQGVGFRPLVFNLAQELKLKGEVFNDTKGVVIFLSCDEAKLELFLQSLKANLPALARIAHIHISIQKARQAYIDFSITKSKQSLKTSAILSDFALCEACKNEFYDPKNPRYHYPFITCTHCGVRFSIIKKLPYDRQNTSMAEFKMCEFCQSEFKDPKNRRFHAQPISCPECAIKVHLKDSAGRVLASDEKAFKESARLLKQGKVLAIKGMGGFHLVCDALNEKAVKLLRERKHRPFKPLALMCKDMQMALKLAFITPKEEELLNSILKPIVLLKAKKMPAQIAFDTDKIGIMLAYTPFHLLLFEYFSNPIVATSANISSESIIYSEKALLEKLNGVFDYYLDYEREIVNASDDSIACVVNDECMFLRTSRGINPTYIELDENFKNETALALGAELKNQFVIAFDNKLLISPYIGDLKSLDTKERFETLLDFFRKSYDLNFTQVISDKHPHFSLNQDYKKAFKLQHHYAHACAVLFEHGFYTQKLLVFAFDGTGYGDDGHIWGGEVFQASLKEYERVAHFDEFKLINADITQIQNLALGFILKYDLEQEACDFLATIDAKKWANLKKIYTQSKLYTSSLGRIIDAFGSVIFDKERLDYEAQIGLLMEKYYDFSLNYSYNFEFKNNQICVKNAFLQALKDDKKHACTGFLNALATCIIKLSTLYKKKLHLDEKLPVLLCGGVFQNTTLLTLLKNRGLNFKTGLKFPVNDSSIALGQMVHYLKK
ncbi:carbamoyltransferase HypF [Campylobacter sp. MIT 12-8780]|uniref:carbamoyltransferase HypF n=1 Tax=unclassified Campylobacter TaxID=2593542 RepID=UPI00115D8DA1|nr:MULTISPECIES: carbamoyltransferase HypF [unclassified Campylobacter]NDJ28165.1 carbamoyltransferase HypF [Campylobacter sp. MIT 19-121]TQR42015.1 carbamoyltransferase HypF [Campylobacter sp. MIT 12-8780]